MTPMKSVNLDELSLIYPVMGKLKNIFLSIGTVLEAEGSKFQNSPCPQVDYHILHWHSTSHFCSLLGSEIGFK